METSKKKILTLEEINEILSDALLRVAERKLPLKQATLISKLAMSLSKNIVNTELKNRVEFLEQQLKHRK